MPPGLQQHWRCPFQGAAQSHDSTRRHRGGFGGPLVLLLPTRPDPSVAAHSPQSQNAKRFRVSVSRAIQARHMVQGLLSETTLTGSSMLRSNKHNKIMYFTPLSRSHYPFASPLALTLQARRHAARGIAQHLSPCGHSQHRLVDRFLDASNDQSCACNLHLDSMQL